MLHTHKKQITWELLNRRLDKFLSQTTSKEMKKTKFGDQEIHYYDMTDDSDYEFVVHTASDRAVKRIVQDKNLFDSSPYISCSLINPDLGLFRVNPSLLQANILFEFPVNAVIYTVGYDIGSPTNKYNLKEEQHIFLNKLKQQTFFANTVDAKLREAAREKNIMGTSNWSKLPSIVERISRVALTDELKSADPKKGQIEALPLLSTDMLRSNTKSPYNEILIKDSKVKIKAIAFNESDWKNALNAVELNNLDAITSMQAIIESKLPIVVIKNKFDHRYHLSQYPTEEEKLLAAAKNHDLNLLQQLIKTIDVKNFAGAALQEACYQGDFTIVKLLVENNANVNFGNGKPLQAAFYRGQNEIAKYLIEKGAEVAPIETQLKSYLEKRPNKKLNDLIESGNKIKPSMS